MTTTYPYPALPLGHTIVGTCGLCGGPVTTPTIWMSVSPPPRTCSDCGAEASESFGPVIPMVPKITPGTTRLTVRTTTQPPFDFSEADQ